MKIDSKQFARIKEAIRVEEQILMAQTIVLCKMADMDIDKVLDTASDILNRRAKAFKKIAEESQ